MRSFFSLEHRHAVPGAIELGCRREPGRTRTNDGDLLPSARGRRLGNNPPFVERTIHNRQLDRLDSHGIVVDAEDARAFAGRRAQQARELREVVGEMQPIDRRAPRIAIHQIVPIRNQVAQRTTLMAERHAAVHAACGLTCELIARVRRVHVVVVAHALGDRTSRGLDARELDKSGGFAHVRPRPDRRRLALVPWPWHAPLRHGPA